MSIVFQSKHAGESRTVQFDFSSLLSTGETITSALVGPLVYSGTDLNPILIINGVASIAGALVSQNITAGVQGCVYELVCQVTTSLGQTLQISGMLAVTEPPPGLVGGGGAPVTSSSIQYGIQFQDEGVNLGGKGTADTLNFIGSTVTATRVGSVVTATVSGGTPFEQQGAAFMRSYVGATGGILLDSGSLLNALTGASSTPVSVNTLTWINANNRFQCTGNAGVSAGFWSGAATCVRWASGYNGAGRGGFDIWFAIQTGTTFTNLTGVLVGVCYQPNQFTTATPSTNNLTGWMGLIHDSGAANWFVGSKNQPSNVSGSTVDTGIALATIQPIAFRMTCAPGSLNVRYSMQTFNPNDGTLVSSFVATLSSVCQQDCEATFVTFAAAGNQQFYLMRAMGIYPDIMWATL